MTPEFGIDPMQGSAPGNLLGRLGAGALDRVQQLVTQASSFRRLKRMNTRIYMGEVGRAKVILI
jgi:hypothetical protein